MSERCRDDPHAFVVPIGLTQTRLLDERSLDEQEAVLDQPGRKIVAVWEASCRVSGLLAAEREVGWRRGLRDGA